MHLFDDARQTGKQEAQHDHDNPFPAGCRRGFAAIPQQPDGYKHDGDTDRLLELYCTANVQTAQGVGIGASRKDVEAAYGTDYTQAGTTMTYALAAQDSLTIPASLYFELDGDTVCAIGLTSTHRAE